MKGYTFYLEYESNKNKRKGIHSGNCIAVYGDWYRSSNGYCKEGLYGAYNWENSAVCSGNVNGDYLRDNCKRIGEKQAREIHPNLFYVLDKK